MKFNFLKKVMKNRVKKSLTVVAGTDAGTESGASINQFVVFNSPVHKKVFTFKWIPKKS